MEVVRTRITPEASARATEEAAASSGPTLLLDFVHPDRLRTIKRYCAWLGRNLPSDSLIAARFDRSFQRLRRLGKPEKPFGANSDMPSCWNGPSPVVDEILAELSDWHDDEALTEWEKHVITICIAECKVRMERQSIVG